MWWQSLYHVNLEPYQKPAETIQYGVWSMYKKYLHANVTNIKIHFNVSIFFITTVHLQVAKMWQNVERGSNQLACTFCQTFTAVTDYRNDWGVQSYHLTLWPPFSSHQSLPLLHVDGLLCHHLVLVLFLLFLGTRAKNVVVWKKFWLLI